MIESILGIINNELRKIGVPYEFMKWTSPVTYPYWVGEFTESPTDSEDGYEECTFMLTGTVRDTWLELVQQKAKIQDHFPTVGGLRVTTDKGVVVVFYSNSFPVDTGEANLKRMQVNLQIKAWKGMK